LINLVEQLGAVLVEQPHQLRRLARDRLAATEGRAAQKRSRTKRSGPDRSR
jgi:hypothetical protein